MVGICIGMVYVIGGENRRKSVMEGVRVGMYGMMWIISVGGGEWKVLIGGMGVMIMSRRWEGMSWERMIMGWGVVIGGCIIVGGESIVRVVVGGELQGIGIMGMVGGRGREGGVRYYIMGSVGTGMMLMGGGMMSMESGRGSVEMGGIGGTVWISGVMVKMGIGGYGRWVEEVYGGLRKEEGEMVGIVGKMGWIGMMVERWEENEISEWIMIGNGVWAWMIGISGGMNARRVGKMMGMMGVGSGGYVGIGIGSGMGEKVWIYVIVSGMMEWVIWESMGEREVREVVEGNKWRKMGVISGMMSVGGIRRMWGYMGKVGIIEGMVMGGRGILAVIGVGMSVGVVYYGMRWVRVCMMRGERECEREENMRRMGIIIGILIMGGDMCW